MSTSGLPRVVAGLQRSRGVSAADGPEGAHLGVGRHPFNGAAASPPRMAVMGGLVVLDIAGTFNGAAASPPRMADVLRAGGPQGASFNGAAASPPRMDHRHGRHLGASDPSTEPRRLRRGWRPTRPRPRPGAHRPSTEPRRLRRGWAAGGAWAGSVYLLQRSRGVSAADGQVLVHVPSRGLVLQRSRGVSAADGPADAPDARWEAYDLQRSRGVSAADGRAVDAALGSAYIPSTEPRRLRRGWRRKSVASFRVRHLQRSRGVSAADGGRAERRQRRLRVPSTEPRRLRRGWK